MAEVVTSIPEVVTNDSEVVNKITEVVNTISVSRRKHNTASPPPLLRADFRKNWPVRWLGADWSEIVESASEVVEKVPEVVENACKVVENHPEVVENAFEVVDTFPITSMFSLHALARWLDHGLSMLRTIGLWYTEQIF